MLEIGTGWGGFAVHAAPTRGCRSPPRRSRSEQHDIAERRVAEAGVEHLVDLLLDDYRDLRGTYDKLVSLEMIEAVGWRHFGTFFERCCDLLAPNGTMLLQAITMDDRAYQVEKASKSFIRTYVFPGGCLPSLAVIAKCVARRTDMRTVHLEDLTPHYAETLRRWRANFEAATEESRRARLRRALPPPVADVPQLLRGRVRRAPDRPRADRARQAAGRHRRAAEAPPVLSARLPAEHPAAERVDQERRPARGELGDRESARRGRRSTSSSSIGGEHLAAHSPGSTLSQPDVSM